MHALSEQVSANIAKLSVIREKKDKIDAKFPFRSFAKQCDPGAWSLGMKRFLVGRDAMSNFAGQMGDPIVDSTMAALKDAVSLRSAPRSSWNALCLPSHGGGPGRFPSFVMERCDDADGVTAAIARKLLAVYTLLEKRLTSAASSKKSSPAKITDQRAELMNVVYHF